MCAVLGVQVGCMHQIAFPASRGLFSVVFAELPGERKRDLCPGSKWTVLGMNCHVMQCYYASSLRGVTVN